MGIGTEGFHNDRMRAGPSWRKEAVTEGGRWINADRHPLGVVTDFDEGPIMREVQVSTLHNISQVVSFLLVSVLYFLGSTSVDKLLSLRQKLCHAFDTRSRWIVTDTAETLHQLEFQ